MCHRSFVLTGFTNTTMRSVFHLNVLCLIPFRGWHNISSLHYFVHCGLRWTALVIWCYPVLYAYMSKALDFVLLLIGGGEIYKVHFAKANRSLFMTPVIL